MRGTGATFAARARAIGHAGRVLHTRQRVGARGLVETGLAAALSCAASTGGRRGRRAARVTGAGPGLGATGALARCARAAGDVCTAAGVSARLAAGEFAHVAIATALLARAAAWPTPLTGGRAAPRSATRTAALSARAARGGAPIARRGTGGGRAARGGSG